MRKLLLIGGGGHCRSILDSLRKSGCYDRIGIIDREPQKYAGVDLAGTDEDLPVLYRDGWTEAFISVGSVGNNELRHRLQHLAKEAGMTFPVIIDPSAILAEHVTIGEGTYVGKRAVVNEGSDIGAFSIVNTGAIIEHDCRIGSYTHVCPGAIVCGGCNLENDTLIGAGSVVKQGICIGCDVVIGAGSVVVKDVPNGVRAYGNPCTVKQ